MLPPLYCTIKVKMATLFRAAALWAAQRPAGLKIANLDGSSQICFSNSWTFPVPAILNMYVNIIGNKCIWNLTRTTYCGLSETKHTSCACSLFVTLVNVSVVSLDLPKTCSICGTCLLNLKTLFLGIRRNNCRIFPGNSSWERLWVVNRSGNGSSMLVMTKIKWTIISFYLSLTYLVSKLDVNIVVQF